MMRNKFTIFSFFFFVSFFRFIKASTNLPAAQYEALYSLYNSTQGGSWTWNTPYSKNGYPWDFTDETMNDPCSSSYPWQGITCSTICSSNSCDILEINLESHDLMGSIPSQISEFTALTSLYLSFNQLTSSIPSEITQLTSLLNLYLDENDLTGSLPSSIGDLSQLVNLHVGYNALTGSIPSNIGQWTRLSYLSLKENRLIGTIPALISQWTEITQLYLNNNVFSGTLPEEIGQLDKLLLLDVEYNHFTGSIPTTIGQLTRLTDLYLDENNLSGSIPIELSQLTNLIECYLSMNHFFGSISSELFIGFTKLEYLLLDSNYLTGSLPSTINQISSLLMLDVSSNQLTSSLPNELYDLTELTGLYLYSNQFTGSLTSQLMHLTKLNDLEIDFNAFTGTFPSEINVLLHLEYLNVQDNLFSGSIPNTLGQLTRLTSCYFSNNMLTNSIPDNIGNLTYLQYLDINMNVLTGSIPISMIQLTQLIQLTLSTNQLTSTIPSLMTQSIELTYWDMEINYFTGALTFDLPSTLISTSLYFFSCRNNYLTSMIPMSLWSINTLTYLFLDNNMFSQSIVYNLTMFHENYKLQYLDLSNNSLTNTLPTSFFQHYSDLVYINLANNQFIGALPSPDNPNHSLQILYLQNNSFTGTIPTNLISSGSLQIIIASLNCFSGTISSDICQNKQLIQLIFDGLHASTTCQHTFFPWLSSYPMSSNSVYGSLPSCLFELPQLISLHVSGNNLDGSLPTQITKINNNNMNLTMLNLANNRFSGLIPSYILSNPNLINLDLSFNQFNAFGEDISLIKAFANDSTETNLSPNTLNTSSNSSISTSLRLHVNHLSGHIPSVWQQTKNIDMLEGNMFSCDLNRQDLPQFDPLIDSYQCDSENTNVSLIVFLLLLSLLMVLIKCILPWKHIIINYFMIHIWLLRGNKLQLQLDLLIQELMGTTFVSPSSPSYSSDKNVSGTSFQSLIQMIKLCEQLSRWILQIICVFIGLLCVVYIVLSWYYFTYKHQYVWIVSASYLSGVLPSLVLLVLFMVILVLFMREWCVFPSDSSSNHTSFPSNNTNYNTLSPTTNETTSSTSEKISTNNISFHNYIFWIQILGLFVGNLTIVLLINVGYILAINRGYPSVMMTIISIALSIFKLIWNDVILLGKGRLWVEEYVQYPIPGPFIFVLCVCNNIIIPYLAETLISPNCFLYVISDPPMIQSTYYNIHCYPEEVCLQLYCSYQIYCDIADVKFALGSLFTLNTTTNNMNNMTKTNNQHILSSFSLSSSASSIISMDYLPPFHYNFTCSSSLLSAFGSVFVYRYLFSSVLIPFVFAILKYFQQHYLYINVFTLKKGTTTSISNNKEDNNKQINQLIYLQAITQLLPNLMKFECYFVDSTKDSTYSTQEIEVTKNIICEDNSQSCDLISNNIDNNHNNLVNNHVNLENNTTNIPKDIESLNNQPQEISQTHLQYLKQTPLEAFQATQYTIEMILQSFQRNKWIGETLAIKLLVDMTMLMSFGLLFPPLGWLIVYSLCYQIIQHHYYLLSIIDYYILLLQSMKQHSVESISFANNKEIIKHLICLLHQVLCQLNHYYQTFNELFVVGMRWIVWLVVWFWAICLYDTLGKSQGSIVSLWIVFAMGFAPSCCYLVSLSYRLWYWNDKKIERKEDHSLSALELNTLSIINNPLTSSFSSSFSEK